MDIGSGFPVCTWGTAVFRYGVVLVNRKRDCDEWRLASLFFGRSSTRFSSLSAGHVSAARRAGSISAVINLFCGWVFSKTFLQEL